jgi:hypothetical protein
VSRQEGDTPGILATTRSGDVLLVGGLDPYSLAVQVGTGCRYSHAAVVVGPNLAVEAYDFSLGLDEGREGVYFTSITGILSRSKLARRVVVLRPVTSPAPVEVKRVADLYRANSPTFPSVGVLLLALCGLIQPLLWVFPAGPRRAVARKLLGLAGDGLVSVQCAELAVRVLHEFGVEIEFSTLYFGRLLGHIEPPPATRTLRRRFADVGPGFEATPRGQVARARAAFASFRRALGHRRADTAADWQDFVLPVDLLQSPSLRPVGHFERRGDHWRPPSAG